MDGEGVFDVFSGVGRFERCDASGWWLGRLEIPDAREASRYDWAEAFATRHGQFVTPVLGGSFLVRTARDGCAIQRLGDEHGGDAEGDACVHDRQRLFRCDTDRLRVQAFEVRGTR